MLSYRSMLVHMDASPAAMVRLKAARHIAATHGASLRALFAVQPDTGGGTFSFSAGAAAEVAQMDLDGRQRTRDEFERTLLRGGLPVAWDEVRAEPVVNALVVRALPVDLLVLGQHDAASPRSGTLPRDFAPAVVMRSGRPALVMPRVCPPIESFRRVLIAWKASREAARAITAALPLLQRASQVHVATWPEAAGADDTHSTDHLQAQLARHGVSAIMKAPQKKPPDIGEALLAEAAQVQADLIVMGCFGHSRAREWLLGGVSRRVFDASTVPVLMAH